LTSESLYLKAFLFFLNGKTTFFARILQEFCKIIV